MKKIKSLLVFVLIATISFSQNIKPVAQKVYEAYRNNSTIAGAELFTVEAENAARTVSLEGVVSDATVLLFKVADAKSLVNTKPDLLVISIPVKNSQPVYLKLIRTNIFTPDFKLTTGSSNGQEVNYTGGVHYQGIVDGDNNSIAAISIFNDEVMGLISSPAFGNLVLGKIKDDANSAHIFYNDRNLSIQPNIECVTPADNQSYTANELKIPTNQTMMVNCLRMFWEVNYNIFTDKGSVTNAANYVIGLFNQSAIIYTNDGIPVELSEVFLWDVVSPYTGTTSGAYLGQFQTYRNTINGDLGHLLGYGGGGGVAAGFSGICASNLNSSQCYSGINSTYSNVPTYSWSVMVVTHEQGHLMGSRHTHSCSWNGNSTAIDGCGPAAGYGYEGSCSGAPIPAGGGTIMSYCHLNGVGINLALGFGAQPAAVIINNYNNGACLTACVGTACMPPPSMNTSNVTTTTANFNWTAATGAPGYNIRYRIIGSGTWITATANASPYNATGLTNGANYEWQVQTNCGAAGTSIFTISTNFTTIPVNCITPTNLSTTNLSSSSATFNWAAVGGAASYSIRYRIVGTSTWSTGTSTTTSFSAFSLTGTSNYEWQIQTLCVGGATSAFSASINFTTPTPPCSNSQNNYTTNISNVSATLNWGGVTGGSGISVNVRNRIVGTSTWTTVNLLSPTTSLNVTGLTSNSNYEWQIQTVCQQSSSAFSNSILFTTLNASCPSPTNFTVIQGVGEVNLFWDLMPGATSYEIELKDLTNNMTFFPTFTSANSAYSLVTGSAIHEAKVRSVCTGGMSGYTVINFTTQCVPPISSINVNGSTTICQGQSVQLSYGLAWYPYTYKWFRNNVEIAGATGTSYNATQSGSYKLEVTFNSVIESCSTMSAPVVITVLNTPTAVISGNPTFCAGSNTTMYANTGSGITYQWYRNTFAISGATASTYAAGNAGTYYVIETVSCGTSQSNSLVITQINNPAPSISYITPLAFCSPGSVVLTSSTFSGVTYQWQKNGSDIAGATSQIYTALTNGSYKVKQTANGCYKSSPAVTTTTAANITAAITANGPVTFCNGGSVVLSVTGAVPGYSYQWKNNNVNIAGAIASSYTASAAGSYSILVSASCGSATSNIIQVSTGGITASVSPAGTINICNGAVVALNANAGTGYAYQWYFNGNIISGATVATYNATTAGTYTVAITSPCGNATSAATTVAITAVTATVSPVGTSVICAGLNITYSANTGYNYAYQWRKNGVNLTGATLATYKTSSNGNYSVIITQGGICSATSANATLTVTNNPTPTITAGGNTTFCAGQSVTLTANTFAGVTYQWEKSGNDIAGATAQSYIATTAGLYKVRQTANGCTKSSSGITVVVNCRVTGVGNSDDPGSDEMIKVFPNPFSEEFTVYGLQLNAGDRIQLINVLGEIVQSQTIRTSTSNFKLQTSNIEAGVYFMQITTSSAKKTVKVVKQ